MSDRDRHVVDEMQKGERKHDLQRIVVILVSLCLSLVLFVWNDWLATVILLIAFVGFIFLVIKNRISDGRWEQAAAQSNENRATNHLRPMPCPTCGFTEHHYDVQGLWDGKDPATGAAVGGTVGYGRCKRCGGRWAQWDNAPPYVPPDEEWDREVTTLAWLLEMKVKQR